MKERVSLKDLRGLLALMEDGTIRASFLSEKVAKRLREEHLVSAKRDRRTIIFSSANNSQIKGFTQRLCRTEDLDGYLKVLEDKQAGNNPTRSDAAKLVNDTKAFGTDVMKGIRLNAIWPIDIFFDGQPFRLDPPKGTSFEVDDESLLEINPEITVVGVENYDTFMRIKDYAHLFDAEKPYLFTYRATYGKDSYGRWIEWLKRIPNQYLHFGDLDKGGLRIYIDSFRSVLGERASFLIPENYEELIRTGSIALYDKQYGEAAPDTGKDPRIQPLLDAIEKFHKSCEQEKLSRPRKTP